MTAKEKAEELAGKYSEFTVSIITQKQCALIAVDEILSTGSLTGGWHESVKLPNNKTMTPYWLEVKTEIEKL